MQEGINTESKMFIESSSGRIRNKKYMYFPIDGYESVPSSAGGVTFCDVTDNPSLALIPLSTNHRARELSRE